MKKLLVVSLFLILCLALTACGAGGAGDVVGAEDPTANVDPNQDLSGTYTNADAEYPGDIVELTKEADGTYTVLFSMYNLADLTGTGTDIEGGVALTLTDPGFSPVLAIFSQEEGGDTYSLEVTESQWDYMLPGDVFTGFVME